MDSCGRVSEAGVSLGFATHGTGAARVLVLHDWFCDGSSWDAALPFLTLDRFTYVFADLRGYGASREIGGSFSLEEAAGDVLALADGLGWTRFSLVGHSMSGLIVQRVLHLAPERVVGLVAVTPVSPAGMGLDREAVELFRSIALAGEEERFAAVGAMWGSRLSETWIRYKLRRWRETASPEAAAAYVELWGRGDVLDGMRRVETPVLIVACGQDAPPFRAEALEASMLPYYAGGRVVSLGESGHYPMQEQPPLLMTAIEGFLGGL